MKEPNDHFDARAGASMLAGIIAGLVMALVAMIRATTMGMSFWLPVHEIAAAFQGVSALLGGWGPTLVGLGLHLAMSATFGLIFGMYAWRWSIGKAVVGGLATGLVIWFVMTLVVLSWANPVMHARIVLIPGSWFVYHLVFGTMLSITPRLIAAFHAATTRNPAPASAGAHGHA